MARIAAIIADDFEDREYTEPAQAFAHHGHEVVTVGLKAGAVVKGKKQGTPVAVDLAVGLASPDDFDALFIPGGYSPDKLRADDRAVRFAAAFMQAGKPVLAICHAGQLLVTADVLRGRTLTGWTSIRKDLENAGATFVDQEVVVDGNLVSSRKPDDIPAFIRASVERLERSS